MVSPLRLVRLCRSVVVGPLRSVRLCQLSSSKISVFHPLTKKVVGILRNCTTNRPTFLYAKFWTEKGPLWPRSVVAKIKSPLRQKKHFSRISGIKYLDNFFRSSYLPAGTRHLFGPVICCGEGTQTRGERHGPSLRRTTNILCKELELSLVGS